MSDNRVALFSRYPVPGKAKTRLIPAVGDGGAAYCQTTMTEKLLRETSNIAASVELWYAGGDLEKMKYWMDRTSTVTLKEQAPGGLGEKITAAFVSAFSEGAGKVIVVGADIPDIDQTIIENAFNELEHSPMVIQGALDGGYVLVGLSTHTPETIEKLFTNTIPNINWGTETVCDEQLQAASNAGVQCKLIGNLLSDVDTIQELDVFSKATGVSIRCLKSPKIGIIVPTLNEAGNLAERVPRWISAAAHPENLIITFSDGGSSDDTPATVATLQKNHDSIPIKFVSSGKGRGLQISTGIRATDCDIVMMVHADTVLPDGFDETVVGIIRTPGVSGGAFRLALDTSTCMLNIVVKGANARSVHREIPYGDQSIFVAKHVLERIGGVREDYPLLEDLELTSRLRAAGHIVTAQQFVVTSSRRWTKHGCVKITVVNQLVLIAYSLGVSPSTLSLWYYKGGPGWWVPIAIVFFLLTAAFFVVFVGV
eukprot:TRINITY_DN5661_c0_g1_i1.p1 TRINITY_DN5661_c0_g1~~TRINITY_DN5661_c0_g1_i1.p1  ORF type:complete len:482 (+),score=62.29 TRINITY_DN5661_c0_g1_i1:51-1496(+)